MGTEEMKQCFRLARKAANLNNPTNIPVWKTFYSRSGSLLAFYKVNKNKTVAGQHFQDAYRICTWKIWAPEDCTVVIKILKNTGSELRISSSDNLRVVRGDLHTNHVKHKAIGVIGPGSIMLRRSVRQIVRSEVDELSLVFHVVPRKDVLLHWSSQSSGEYAALCSFRFPQYTNNQKRTVKLRLLS